MVDCEHLKLVRYSKESSGEFKTIFIMATFKSQMTKIVTSSKLFAAMDITQQNLIRKVKKVRKNLRAR